MVKQKRKIPSKKISVNKLMELLPDDVLDDLAEGLLVDKWVKKLKAKPFFKLLMFSILSSDRLSLRIMEDNFKDPLFRALAPLIEDEEICHTGIRDRLVNINSDLFRVIFETVYARARELYGEECLEKYHIKRYDSTMIATFSHLLHGMRVGNTSKGKTQVKMTAEYSDNFLINVDFHKEQSFLSEERALRVAIESAQSNNNDVHVFDNGLKSRRTFESFSKTDISFVTRLSQKPRYLLHSPYWQDDGRQDSDELEFIQDSIVQLYGSGNKLFQTKFRLVQYQLKTSVEGKKLSFLTNIWDIPSYEVARIYKTRWDIEVLFRFLKQEMNLTHFVSNDTNAIMVMLYTTLIASMLVLIYKKENEVKSYKKAKTQFFKELLYTILLEIIECPEKTKKLIVHLKRYNQVDLVNSKNAP